ncbi:hypothetical protein FHT40_004209 [Mycolicibacterium sp. BK556]|uniref:phage major capsid family protein n=1 Tax=unclassified Mycolicibacterium TaxID=2636767 RepID=UPI00160B8417|nr:MULTISPECIES: phage major capsid protein [unclassified Mycolicibacterium]MBB3604531.1 hypothetical protein [Mycolicibacterium sp. BK556]MBB3634756.1 hypothetical protein [Mycolicibacterium sp. BK607]
MPRPQNQPGPNAPRPACAAGSRAQGSLDNLFDFAEGLPGDAVGPGVNCRHVRNLYVRRCGLGDHILVDPLGWGELRKLKTASSYNSSLIGAGTTDAARMLLSLPVIVDPAVTDYTGLVIDKRAIVSAVGPVKIATSEHQYFSSDSVLLRATWRFGHVVVRPERLGKFAITPEGS